MLCAGMLALIDYGSDTNVPPLTVSSGLDLTTAQIMLDSMDVTSNFYLFATGAVGNGSSLAAGPHTWSATIADVAGNVAITSVTFTATGAPNPNAPVMSNLDLDEGVVTILPDLPEVWVQGKVSGDGTTVAASVNGGEPIAMNRRDDDFGYLLPLAPGTNVIVLMALAPVPAQQQARHRKQDYRTQDGPGNPCSKVLIVARSTRYQAGLDWPTFGKFANGANQTVSGTVGQYTTDDGSRLSLASLTVGGIAIPPDDSDGSYSGSFSASLPPPDGCTNSIMPIIVSTCWTGSTFSMTYTSVCADVPLGLLEGYEIVKISVTNSWRQPGPNVVTTCGSCVSGQWTGGADRHDVVALYAICPALTTNYMTLDYGFYTNCAALRMIVMHTLFTSTYAWLLPTVKSGQQIMEILTSLGTGSLTKWM